MSGDIDFVDVDSPHCSARIEYQWVGERGASLPLMVFLHEGLGSLRMWKDFPERLCRSIGFRGLVFSRPGYGFSSARAQGWAPDFKHRQAHEMLPAFLEALQIDTLNDPPWLFGHSEGGSIALLYAARFPARVAGVIALAPHILVEDLTIHSIEQARETYRSTDLREKMARYHADPDSVFQGWQDIWLLPAFREWSIEREIGSIECPLLAVQGIDDEYGTLEQIHGIARRVKHTRLEELADCGHSPHRDQAPRLIGLCAEFIAAQADAGAGSRVVCSAR